MDRAQLAYLFPTVLSDTREGGDDVKRMRMSRGGSRRNFSRNSGVHPMNMMGTPMRGGIRL